LSDIIKKEVVTAVVELTWEKIWVAEKKSD
jgi:hypothetical protein